MEIGRKLIDIRERENKKSRDFEPVTWNTAMNFRRSGVSVLFFPLLLAACGGYIPDRSGSLLTVADWLHDGTGNRVVFDRNGNVKNTASVNRQCNQESEFRFRCIDMAVYNTGRREKRTLYYQVHYNHPESTISVTIQGDRAALSGELNHSSGLFNGRFPVPLDETRTASVEFRINSLTGNQKPLLERIEYRMLGVPIGREETFWFSADRSNRDGR